MFIPRLLSILLQLTPAALLQRARARLPGLFGRKRRYRAPDLESMLRREVGLPCQKPEGVAANERLH